MIYQPSIDPPYLQDILRKLVRWDPESRLSVEEVGPETETRGGNGWLHRETWWNMGGFTIQNAEKRRTWRI